MKTAQVTVYDVRGMLRRRRKVFFIPVILVTILCTVGAFVLPRKYESSTTILVKGEEAGNPLLRFNTSFVMSNPNEDKFKTYSEIIYSHHTITALMDSIGLRPTLNSEAARQKLIKSISSQITAEKRGIDAFRISFVDEDPVLAQRATTYLAQIFIQTNARMENQENELAVKFFEQKLDEFKQKYAVSQRERVTELNKRISQVPVEDRLLSTNLDDVERRIMEIDNRIKIYRQSLATLRTFPQAFQSESGKQDLFNLEMNDLPFMDELHTLLTRYEEFAQKYTPKYPDLVRTREQIVNLIGRIRNAVEAEILKQLSQRADLERKRGQLVGDIRRSSVVQKTDQEKESNYEIYRQLYDETKIKLEQAQAISDLGKKGKNEFVILDPALLPTEPSKPKRALLIGGGLGVGLLLGVVLSLIAEFLDPTIRSVRDIELYQKPVVAFIPEGYRHQLPY